MLKKFKVQKFLLSFGVLTLLLWLGVAMALSLYFSSYQSRVEKIKAVNLDLLHKTFPVMLSYVINKNDIASLKEILNSNRSVAKIMVLTADNGRILAANFDTSKAKDETGIAALEFLEGSFEADNIYFPPEFATSALSGNILERGVLPDGVKHIANIYYVKENVVPFWDSFNYYISPGWWAKYFNGFFNSKSESNVMKMPETYIALFVLLIFFIFIFYYLRFEKKDKELREKTREATSAAQDLKAIQQQNKKLNDEKINLENTLKQKQWELYDLNSKVGTNAQKLKDLEKNKEELLKMLKENEQEGMQIQTNMRQMKEKIDQKSKDINSLVSETKRNMLGKLAVVALGGGSEIGGSCYALEIENNIILVDMGAKTLGKKTELVDFFKIYEEKYKRIHPCVIITHAHFDHSGSLPRFVNNYSKQGREKLRVHCTEPTKDLMQLLFEDSANNGHISTQEHSAVKDNSLIVTHKFYEEFGPSHNGSSKIGENEFIKIKLIPAGHIAGAASVLLEWERCGAVVRILVSGDICKKDQLSVAGLDYSSIEPGSIDIFICESTYGAEVERDGENVFKSGQEFASKVFALLADGKCVLIPSFAIGRAQEILLTFNKELASQKPSLAKGQIVIDGMAKRACEIYSKYSADNSLYGVMKDYEEKFSFEDTEGIILKAPDQRFLDIKTLPRCVVSPNGMLEYGRALAYLIKMFSLKGNANGLVFSGYQARETNGYKIRSSTIDSVIVETDTGLTEIFVDKDKIFESGFLSAHIKMQEVLKLIGELKPNVTILVHGDIHNIEQLHATLKTLGHNSRMFGDKKKIKGSELINM